MKVARKSRLTVRVKPAVRRRLVNLARAAGRSTDFLVNDALESYVLNHERMLKEVAQADRQLAAGHFIKHEDMKAWMEQLADDPQAPPPACACGKSHNGLNLCR